MAKIQIRQGVFETNSSSTHAICIKRDDEVSIPDIISKYGGKTFHVLGGEFYWDYEVIHNPETKLDYLFTAISHLYDVDEVKMYMDKMRAQLAKVNVNVEFEYSDMRKIRIGKDKSSYYITFTNPETGKKFDGGIDHPNQNMLAVLNDTEGFLKFVFGENSFLITGNDNSEDFEKFIENNITHVEWMDFDDYAKMPDREYDIYYKGN